MEKEKSEWGKKVSLFQCRRIVSLSTLRIFSSSYFFLLMKRYVGLGHAGTELKKIFLKYVFMKLCPSYSFFTVHITFYLTLNVSYFTADGKIEKNTLLDYIKAFPGK